MHSTTELTEQLLGDLAQWCEGGKRGSFLRVQALGFPFLNFDSSKDYVIEVALIVKGANADLSPGKGLIDRRFDRVLHVIKVDVDLPGFHVSHDLKIVELAVFPWNAFLGQDEVFRAAWLTMKI